MRCTPPPSDPTGVLGREIGLGSRSGTAREFPKITGGHCAYLPKADPPPSTRLSGLLLLVPFASIILINFEPGAARSSGSRLLNRERPGSAAEPATPIQFVAVGRDCHHRLEIIGPSTNARRSNGSKLSAAAPRIGNWNASTRTRAMVCHLRPAGASDRLAYCADRPALRRCVAAAARFGEHGSRWSQRSTWHSLNGCRCPDG